MYVLRGAKLRGFVAYAACDLLNYFAAATDLAAESS
jgi:hypothetical protein